MDLWTPTREWEGQDAYLIGGGPSLTGFDFSRLAGSNVIGCNDAFHLGAEIVTFCIFGDPSWWQKVKWELEKFEGRVVTNAPTILPYKVPGLLKMLRERDGIHSGSTLGWNYSTGAAAINLATSLGAHRIFLLGYDLGNAGSKSHWHAHNGKVTQDYAFKRFMRGFDMVKQHLPEGVEVLNVTDGTTKLEAFPKINFEVFWEIFNQEMVLA